MWFESPSFERTMVPENHNQQWSCLEWGDYRLVSEGYIWSSKKLVALALLLCLPGLLTLPMNQISPMGMGLGALVIVTIILGPRIDTAMKVALFAFVFAVGTTALMFGDTLFFHHGWSDSFLAWDSADVLFLGVLFAIVSAIVALVAWSLAQITHRRPVFRSDLECIQCHHELIGHDSERCPNCGSKISFYAAGLSPSAFRQLAVLVREETVHKCHSRRSIRRVMLMIVTAGAILSAVYACTRPYYHSEETEPPELDWPFMTVVSAIKSANPTSYTLGSGYEIFQSVEHYRYGWPMEWLMTFEVVWEASKDSKPVSIDDAFVVGWVAKERNQLTNMDENQLSGLTVLPAFLRLGQLNTFPSSYHWEISWHRLYSIILLVAVVWYAPYLVMARADR